VYQRLSMEKDEETQSGPNRYCLACSYPLDWLPESRCPECGRPFDPENPETFARFPRRSWTAALLGTRQGRIAIVSVILVVLAALTECGLDTGHRDETCTQCGARSRVNHFYVFGLGGDYGRQVREGPLSRFIQEYKRARCSHSWQGYNFSGGGVLFGWMGSGDSSLFRIAWLDALPPQFADLLKNKAAANPRFSGNLAALIQGNWDEASAEYLGQLEFEGMLWCEQHPR
jgi:hypothetical protein